MLARLAVGAARGPGSLVLIKGFRRQDPRARSRATSVMSPQVIGPSRRDAPPWTVGPMDETFRVLVGYATAAGSTGGIAERIAATLRESGCTVVCRPFGADLDPTPFDAFVLGSAGHNMAWLRPVLDFLGRVPRGDVRPMWCFSVGGVAPRGPLTRHLTALVMRRLEQSFPAALHVRGHRFFGGIVEMDGVPLWGQVFWRLLGGRPGDHRDWPAVESWAREITSPQQAGKRS